MKKNTHNPWTPQDEGDHNPVMKEWWTAETFFTSEDKRKWNLIASFAYKGQKKECFFQYVLFDITNNICVASQELPDNIQSIHTHKNRLAVTYKQSFLRGLYPDYNLHIEDEENNILFDVNYQAKVPPHWVLQPITNGYLPIGLNNYRYGFLPYATITGTLRVNDQTQKINGKGYLEHAYGNWSYTQPIAALKNVSKTFRIYKKLFSHWLSQKTLHIPRHLSFTTENNVYGYDWLWAVFENDWSLFFGNSMFYLRAGPSFGALYLTDENGAYHEFSDVSFSYLGEHYLPDFDMYFPTGYELIGKNGEETIHLQCKSATTPYVYIDRYKGDPHYRAWVLCEMPGTIKARYVDKAGEKTLLGDCKLVPLRIPSKFGHNRLDIDINRKKRNKEIKLNLDSNYFEKTVTTHFRLSMPPHLKIKIYNKK